jgi:hypothetical protein
VTEETKLHLALMQVNNIISLIQGNQYEQFMKGKLVGLQVEINRQLSCLTFEKEQSKIKE